MYTSKLLLHTNGCNIIFILILKEVSIQMSVRNAGKAIQEARKKAGLTQEQLSAKLQVLGCDLTRSALAKIEVGQRHIYPDEMKALHQALGKPYDDLFI